MQSGNKGESNLVLAANALSLRAEERRYGHEKMGIEEIKKVVKDWATSQPLVKKAYLFGSRVRGDFKPDSDLDVAVELHLGADDGNILSTWMFEEDEIKGNLQDLIPFKLQLELLDGKNTPTVLNAVKESGILVYENQKD